MSKSVVLALLSLLWLCSPARAVELRVVTTADVQVRAAPTGAVIDKLGHAQIVLVETRDGGWSRITFKSQAGQVRQGWVANRFLEEVARHFAPSPVAGGPSPSSTTPAQPGARPARAGMPCSSSYVSGTALITACLRSARTSIARRPTGAV